MAKEKNPIMVEAGNKAWVTRQANLRKSTRSQAAVKANQTRGPDGRKNAALKAWETRRENGIQPLSNSFYIHLSNNPILKTKEVIKGKLLVDFDRHGRMIGIEIIDETITRIDMD